MSNFTLIEGSVPLLISMPHNGENIPADIAKYMTEDGRSSKDTDWYKDKLYAFAQDLGAYMIVPKYSRYVIDLNRDSKGVNLYPGANSTELCPTSLFDLSPIYQDGFQPSLSEIERRIQLYWQPYHQALSNTLDAMKQRFGGAILLDAHSIKSQVPRFFEGQLPDFNFGSADGRSCHDDLLQRIAALDLTPYSSVSNGRFKGGYITRAYGEPHNDVEAVQLELSQITYMNEDTLSYDEASAEKVIKKLKLLVSCLIEYGQAKYAKG